MRYTQKNQYPFFRFSIYMMGFAVILGISIITYTIYKRNISEANASQCIADFEAKVAIPGTVRQVLPIDRNNAMVITAADNGVVRAVIYDHCAGVVVRQFTVSASVEPSVE